MADCTETLHDLERFLDGELPEEEHEQVLRHLHECMECYQCYDFQAEVKQMIAAKCGNDEFPPGLLERIRQSLAAQANRPPDG